MGRQPGCGEQPRHSAPHLRRGHTLESHAAHLPGGKRQKALSLPVLANRLSTEAWGQVQSRRVSLRVCPVLPT